MHWHCYGVLGGRCSAHFTPVGMPSFSVVKVNLTRVKRSQGYVWPSRSDRVIDRSDLVKVITSYLIYTIRGIPSLKRSTIVIPRAVEAKLQACSITIHMYLEGSLWCRRLRHLVGETNGYSYVSSGKWYQDLDMELRQCDLLHSSH